MKKVILFLLLFSFSAFSSAKLNTSPFFVQLSDAMAEVKKGENANAIPHLTAMQTDFNKLAEKESESGKAVSKALEQALKKPELPQFEALSKALYRFEKAHNPVDYTAKRQQFAKRVMPVYQKLAQAVQNQDLTAIQAQYRHFNNVWSLNEKVVRETSLGHYGKIETAMSLLRVAMLSEPADFSVMNSQIDTLNQSLSEFNAGKILQVQQVENAPTTLAQGIDLLKQAVKKLENQQIATAQADLALFIQQWAIFEGEVSTKNGELYRKVESELPVIMAKGNDSQNIANFHRLIDELSTISGQHYGVLDVMLILLREGVEALLIIMALLTTLNATHQTHAKRWIYGGASLGLLASIAMAIALQQLFPLASAGKNREMIEGVVGVIAVIMMLFVGAWLHSKSTLQGWKAFVRKSLGKALATGSLCSMLLLAFLAVFREGAETLLFYAGMLPQMALNDFLTGIALALGLLCIIALVMKFSSEKLPIPHLFKIMTWLIYFLGFKMLGVSIHTLQLTNTIPNTLIDSLPNMAEIGWFASFEGAVAQISYLLIILAMYFRQNITH